MKDLLCMSFMFENLDMKEMNVVLNAMEQEDVKSGSTVIEQGQEGHSLYVVGTGSLSCSKKIKDEVKFLKNYEKGEVFGELALLYNCTRAATVTATEDCQLWKLDRETFHHIVKDASIKKREKYEDFLSKVPILQTMEPYEKQIIAECCKEERYTAGT